MLGMGHVLRISAVAASPKNKDELAAAREALEPALAEAFADTTFSPEQVALLSRYRARLASPKLLPTTPIVGR